VERTDAGERGFQQKRIRYGAEGTGEGTGGSGRGGEEEDRKGIRGLEDACPFLGSDVLSWGGLSPILGNYVFPSLYPWSRGGSTPLNEGGREKGRGCQTVSSHLAGRGKGITATFRKLCIESGRQQRSPCWGARVEKKKIRWEMLAEKAV